MQTYLGNTTLSKASPNVNGEIIDLQGESFYKISNVDQMRPFFMSLVSDANHWMFISSNGGLTAGRKNSEYALFPYYTDDKITESAGSTGCKTLIRVRTEKGARLWEPFSQPYAGMYRTQRNLYKNRYGNTLIFEEINEDLGMRFWYQWQTSNQYGFVRTAHLVNTSDVALEVDVLDGLLNLLPHGVTTELQQTRSNLVDAYKKSEMRPDTGLGIYALSAIIVDRAEPSEALKANVVWSHGMPSPTYLVSGRQLEAFRLGEPLVGETENKGEKGAYLMASETRLAAGATCSWTLVANVNQGPAAVANLQEALKTPKALLEAVAADTRAGTHRLLALAGAADGHQHSADSQRTMRHYANVMYNIMRGGIMDHHYQLDKADVLPYLRKANLRVYEAHRELLAQLPENFTRFEFLKRVEHVSAPDLTRLALEYLPLKFSRRHGDPSRPWNKFSINTQRESDGAKILDYQGNWRDIFQNWEALAHAYPDYIDGMILKFLNASTADGYNPYRITKHGVDWEVIEPEDPWSYIGYWGDHQVIYLLKFLEFAQDYFPGRLMAYWDKPLFVYVDVPYRIRPFEAIVRNPRDTIDFDAPRDKELRRRMAEAGSDGALLRHANGEPCRATLAEKLLAMLLAKVSNLIPEAGIWLNTQRPEWNDANNALVGNGVSMVTLYYLHRFLRHLESLLEGGGVPDTQVAEELMVLLDRVEGGLTEHVPGLAGSFGDARRKALVTTLGQAASHYRAGVYAEGFSGRHRNLAADRLLSFTRLLLRYTAHSIEANRREDHLYHAYNLIRLDGEAGIEISHLDGMLEGQVAALSSGYLDAQGALTLLDALRKSPLYRADQNSYILYPDRNLPAFMDKNVIPEKLFKTSELLKQLLQDHNNSIVEQDQAGQVHFHGSFNNAAFLDAALTALPDRYQGLVQRERKSILATYEAVFNHRAFTGRSGTFFAYEGLGSIYWHMVSKLSLAVMECYLAGRQAGAPKAILDGLQTHFHAIEEGIGAHKPPQQYGAFPTDPYSHTPAHRGAQQPGMTGQVKEDILTRRMELGVGVKDGKLQFGPFLVRGEEYLQEPSTYTYRDLSGEEAELELPAGALAFTYCQVPVVYVQSKTPYVEIQWTTGEQERREGHTLDEASSRELFRRTGKITALLVGVPK